MNDTPDRPGVSLRLVGQYDPETVKTYLASCEKITGRCSEVILRRFFSVMDERLEAFALRAASNEEQRRFDDMRRLMDVQHREWVEFFQNSLTEGFKRFGEKRLNTEMAQAQPRQGRLALVDNDVLEENIALSSTSYRSAEAHRGDLWFLSQRLSALNGGLKVQDNNWTVRAAAAILEALLSLQRLARNCRRAQCSQSIRLNSLLRWNNMIRS